MDRMVQLANFPYLNKKSHAMSGHIFDMVNRIAQNKVHKRKKFRADNRENIHSEKNIICVEYDFPKVSKSEMERIKFRIQQESKTTSRKSFFLLILSLLLAAILVWAVVTFSDPGKYPLHY